MIIEPILLICNSFHVLETWPKVLVEIIQKSIKTIKEQGEIF